MTIILLSLLSAPLVKKGSVTQAYPIVGKVDSDAADELVIFDKNQVLPLYLIYL